MDYDRIILEMLDRIKRLEEKVTDLENSEDKGNNIVEDIGVSKKYRYLSDYLESSKKRTVNVSLKQIEDILGFSLPNSARSHRAYWSNTTTHSVALSWLSVGYKTIDVDLSAETIVFENESIRGEQI